MPDEDVVRRNYRTDYTEEMLEIMQRLVRLAGTTFTGTGL